MKILITGISGFIGFHTAISLIQKRINIIGLDNLNDYYDKSLKNTRLKVLVKKGIIFYKIDISNIKKLNDLFKEVRPDYVLNFAAQAGVRYSISNPDVYLKSNIIGFFNILECCKNYEVKHLIYASSSSVYGNNNIYPFDEKQTVDSPVSFYAATKKSNEVMAYSYSHLYQLRTTGLRFFTVYGPFGRPDMAYFIFVKKILNNEPIFVYGDGEIFRDFTYIQDAVIAIEKLINYKKIKNEINKNVPYEIFNVGNNKPVKLLDFIKLIEKLCNKKAIIVHKKRQTGDVNYTAADTNKLKEKINYFPKTEINDGMKIFIDWYKKFYKV